MSSCSGLFALVALCFMRLVFLAPRSLRRLFRTSTVRRSLNSMFLLPCPALVLLTSCARLAHQASASLLSSFLLTDMLPVSDSPFLAAGPTLSVAGSQFYGCCGKRLRVIGMHHHRSVLLA